MGWDESRMNQRKSKPRFTPPPHHLCALQTKYHNPPRPSCIRKNKQRGPALAFYPSLYFSMTIYPRRLFLSPYCVSREVTKKITKALGRQVLSHENKEQNTRRNNYGHLFSRPRIFQFLQKRWSERRGGWGGNGHRPFHLPM